MLSVARLYRRKSLFKYGRALARLPQNFSICCSKAAVPAEYCKKEKTECIDERIAAKER